MKFPFFGRKKGDEPQKPEAQPEVTQPKAEDLASHAISSDMVRLQDLEELVNRALRPEIKQRLVVIIPVSDNEELKLVRLVTATQGLPTNASIVSSQDPAETARSLQNEELKAVFVFCKEDGGATKVKRVINRRNERNPGSFDYIEATPEAFQAWVSKYSPDLK